MRYAWMRRVGEIAFALTVVVHLVVYPRDLDHVREQVAQPPDRWLKDHGHPDEALAYWAQRVAQGQPLDCGAEGGCRYSEIYAALSAAQRWGHAPAAPIQAIDPHNGKAMTLSIEPWETHYFGH
jgi:hypothetical protein